MLIEERLLQVSGNLFKYDDTHDKNLLVQGHVFLCIDRVKGDRRHHYMFHVTDEKQTVSLTHCLIEKEPQLNYTFSEVEKLLMWIGKFKEGSDDVPAWTF